MYEKFKQELDEQLEHAGVKGMKWGITKRASSALEYAGNGYVRPIKTAQAAGQEAKRKGHYSMIPDHASRKRINSNVRKRVAAKKRKPNTARKKLASYSKLQVNSLISPVKTTKAVVGEVTRKKHWSVLPAHDSRQRINSDITRQRAQKAIAKQSSNRVKKKG